MSTRNIPLILNVDDYAPGRYGRTRVLKQAGFSVAEAATGRESLAMVAEHPPDVILLDVNLPDISGFDVCRELRSNPETAAITIVHISASNIETQHLVRGLDGGADSYLVEPVDPVVLIATIKAFLRTRKAEEELRRSNEALQQFTYMVAHELNEPLRTITSHAQLLDAQAAGLAHAGASVQDRAIQSTRFIVNGALRMRVFIDDLLRYSQDTQTDLNLHAVDCEAMFNRVMANLDAAISNSGAIVTHDALPTVSADERLEHVLQNLVSNAIKYRHPDRSPEIHVSARGEADAWCFAIRDNGCGIEPQYQSRIFKLFQRLHGREVSGSGLGLTLCQKIIEAYGGTIRVESAGGQGSTFSFTIPYDPAARAIVR